MAYATTQDDEEQQQNANAGTPNAPQNQPSLTNAGSGLATGQGGGASGAQTAAPTPTPTPQNKGGSQFPDISQYLTQNQAGANRLAAQYAGNVSQAGNTARNDLGNLSTSFNQQAQQGTVPLDQNLTNQAANNPQSFFNFPSQLQQGPPVPAAPPTTPQSHGLPNIIGGPTTTQQVPYFTATPTGATNPSIVNPATNYTPINYQSQVTQPTGPPTVADQAQFNNLQNMMNANYSGPADLTGLANYGQTNTDVNNAANLSAGTATDQGRTDELRQIYGGKVTSPGVANLDNLLLQGQGPTNILRSVANQNTGLPQALTDANTAAQGAAQGATATDQATSAAVKNALQGSYGSFDTDYQNRLKNAQAAEGYQANTTLPNFQRLPPSAFTPVTNVASEDDYDKLAALNSLMGQQNAL